MPQGTQKAMMELVGRVFEVPTTCFEVRTEIAKVCQEMAESTASRRLVSRAGAGLDPDDLCQSFNGKLGVPATRAVGQHN